MRILEVLHCGSGRLVLAPRRARHVLEAHVRSDLRIGTDSDQRTEQGGDHDGADGRGGHQDEGHDPGRPSRQRDRLAARAVGLDEPEPLKHHPKVTMRHTTRFG